MGKPIIASNIGGSRETIINEKTGLLFDSGKVEMLTDALYKFVNMDDKILHSTGLQGRKNILNKFDIIVSNPPYILESQKENLDKNIFLNELLIYLLHKVFLI